MSSDAASPELARPVRAVGPGPDADSLRAAYLDLLKLCLCDVTSGSSREVMYDQQKRVYFRDLLTEAELWRRVEGKDWPLQGLTMVGLPRLDDLQACVESVVRDGVEGDLIEAGAWRGGASILIRATLNSLGARDRTLWVADSFEGFPQPEDEGAQADQAVESEMSGFDFLAPGLEAVEASFERLGCREGVRFVPGFFEETMSGLAGGRWSLIRLDADTYKATKLALETLYPGLAAGGYLILDDYFHPFLPESCKRAVDDFRVERGIVEPIEQIDWTGGRWRRESKPEEPPATSDGAGNVSPRRAATRVAPRPIPSARELNLEDEVVELQTRIRALEAELEECRSARA
jgi:O-methyltransferase